jgi:nicotinate phosphoribosyltransferase
VDDATGEWLPAMKRSDSPVKVLNPGAKRLWRMYDAAGRAVADVLSTAGEDLPVGEQVTLHHHARPDVSRLLTAGSVDELLSTVVDGGRVVADAPGDLAAAGERRRRDIAALDPGVRRLVNPHTYHVSITDDLFTLKQTLLAGLTTRF